MMDYDSYSFSATGWAPHIKSPVIWGEKGNTAMPVCYLTRPKHVSIEDWNDFLNRLNISIRMGR